MKLLFFVQFVSHPGILCRRKMQDCVFFRADFFPNPSKDYTNIIYTAKERCTITIVDILGNQIKTIALNQAGNQKIFVGELPNGIYFGRITNDGNLVAIKKLIIKR